MPLRRAILRHGLHALGLLGILALAGLLAGRIWLEQAVERERAAWREAGLPTTLAELDASYAYPEGGNPAPAYAEAAMLLRASINPARYPELPIVGSWEEPPFGTRWPAETLDLVQRELMAHRDALAILLEERPAKPARYAGDFTEGHDLLLPHLSDLRTQAKYLALYAALAAQEGNGEDAARALRASMRLVRSLDAEPNYLSQIVLTKMLETTHDSLARVLALTPLPRGDAEALDRICRDVDLAKGLRAAVAGETLTWMDFLLNESLQSQVGTMHKIFAIEAPPVYVRLYRGLGAAERDAAELLRRGLVIVELLDTPYPERIERISAIYSAWNSQKDRLSVLPKISSLWRDVFIVEAGGIARLHTMRAALALDQYAQVHGAFPETLDALVPDFLDAVPEDPQTGAPLIYRLEDKGCIVYAFGFNGVDDDGAIELKDSERRQHGDIGMRLPKRREPVKES